MYAWWSAVCKTKCWLTHIIIIIMIRFVARTYPPCWVLKARIQKHRGKPLLFHDKCPGFFYVHYTTHRTYSFTSQLEAIMVKCLAQGHKRRDRPRRDSNPHSDSISTWVQCTRPLGHNAPILWSFLGGHGVQLNVKQCKAQSNNNNNCLVFCFFFPSALKFYPGADAIKRRV